MSEVLNTATTASVGGIASPRVTPLILTYNEAPNIGRTLESLRWAARVVIVDSGSTDETEAIAKRYPNVSWYVRRFDCHREQWRFGIYETGVRTKYLLALDADMVLSKEFVQELEGEFLRRDYAGGIIPFDYLIMGKPLASSILTPQLRLFDLRAVKVAQEGHTQRFHAEGNIYRFKASLVHDDRKSLERWAASQLSYSQLESERILSGGRQRWRDHIRYLGLMPPIAALLAYLRAGGPFRGRAAACYAYQRATYECMLAMRLQSARKSDEL